jgi:N-acetylglucosamine kinase-like BadF-type ATPase
MRELLEKLPDIGSGASAPRTRKRLGRRRVTARSGASLILAVDGGASKADVVLVDRLGNLVGATRRAGTYHLGLGYNGSLEALEAAIRAVCLDGGVDANRLPIAATAVYCVAGADIPMDDRRIAGELAGRGWSAKTIVRNDTFAMLRAGTDRGWGVAVVCGTGLNCAGIGPDGRVVRFPSFGDLSGDRAHGGGWLGRAMLGVAIRARDRRGPRTVLERMAPAHFNMSSPNAVMEAVYLGRLDPRRLRDLAPLAFEAASQGDAVARGLIDELADEVIATAGAAIRRLHVTAHDVEVILGGGVFRSNDARMLRRIGAGIASVAPKAVIRRLQAPPVLGAALIGLDEVQATRAAKARLRESLTEVRLRPRHIGR